MVGPSKKCSLTKCTQGECGLKVNFDEMTCTKDKTSNLVKVMESKFSETFPKLIPVFSIYLYFKRFADKIGELSLTCFPKDSMTKWMNFFSVYFLYGPWWYVPDVTYMSKWSRCSLKKMMWYFINVKYLFYLQEWECYKIKLRDIILSWCQASLGSSLWHKIDYKWQTKFQICYLGFYYFINFSLHLFQTLPLLQEISKS